MTTQGAIALQSAQFIERMNAIAQAGARVPRRGLGGHRRHQARLAAAEGHGRGDAHARTPSARRCSSTTKRPTNCGPRSARGWTRRRSACPTTSASPARCSPPGKSINIPYAYADLRFNPAFDKKTGFFTRSILCVPVVNKQGKTIGVTQVLNKRGGPFTDEDEQRLRAFTAQISIALENAKLFDDVQNDEELQREHAASHVERRDHARRGRQGRHLQRRRARASCAPSRATSWRSTAPSRSSPARTPGWWTSSGGSRETQALETSMDAQLQIDGDRFPST